MRVLLCDADDCLFGSEAVAFDASSEITNRFLAEHGVDVTFASDELRRIAAGRNFRANATALADRFGFGLDDADLDRWVEEERRRVSEQLAATLRPDPAVTDPVRALGERFGLAVVSSSALARLEVCFRAAGLDDLFPPDVRYSAEDSLPEPTSKPDPAVYAFAGRQLGVAGPEALAIEDSVSGVRSAVAAGFPVVANLQFVPLAERPQRTADVTAAGALTTITTWSELLTPH